MKLAGSKGIVSIGACVFFAALVLVATRFAGSRPSPRDDAARLMAAMNLEHLPAGYHHLAGDDTTNARAIWIEHDHAPENARVLAFLVEDGDPSSNKLSRYSSIHMGLQCRQEIAYPKNIGGKYVKVTKTLCRTDDGNTVLEQQGLLHMYKGYSAVIDESAGESEFDHEAFNLVVSAIANAKEGAAGSAI
jgi:hypothetical protein